MGKKLIVAGLKGLYCMQRRDIKISSVDMVGQAHDVINATFELTST
jgi:hypothetical protein